METINDIQSYENEYGQDINMTTFDHSDKATFSFGKTTKSEKNKLFKEVADYKKSVINNILNLKEIVVFKRMLPNYGHFILFDDVKNIYIWDVVKLKNALEDDLIRYNIYIAINNIKESLIHDSNK